MHEVKRGEIERTEEREREREGVCVWERERGGVWERRT